MMGHMSITATQILVTLHYKYTFAHPPPPFAVITALTLLQRLSRRILSFSVGIFAHSSSRAFLRSGTDVR